MKMYLFHLLALLCCFDSHSRLPDISLHIFVIVLRSTDFKTNRQIHSIVILNIRFGEGHILYLLLRLNCYSARTLISNKLMKSNFKVKGE
jgi:hypothetical protein